MGRRASTAPPADGMRTGRSGPTWTDVQDWVGLSGISPEAHSLYVKLRMHVNGQRGDDRAWPGKERLAMLMQVARGDYIDPWLRELEKVGALDIEVEGMPSHNVYVIHNLPPAGYAGPTNLTEWAKEFGDVLQMRRSAARDKTRLQRERNAYYLNAEPPVGYDGPLTPAEWRSLHDAEVRRRADLLARKAARSGEAQGSPVTGEDRKQVTGQGREHVTGEGRVEPKEVEPKEVEPKDPQPHASVGGDASPTQNPEPPAARRCGRDHGDTTPCRACGTNPRAKAAAARAARQNQPCPVEGHARQSAGTCSICAGDRKAAAAEAARAAATPAPVPAARRAATPRPRCGACGGFTIAAGSPAGGGVWCPVCVSASSPTAPLVGAGVG